MALRGGSGGQEEEEEEDDGFGDSFAGFLDAIADSDDEGEGAGTRPKPFGAHRALPPSQPPVAGPPLDDSAAGGRLAAQARSPESAQPPHNEEQVLDGDGGERRAEEEEAFPSNFIQMPSRGLYGNDGGRVGDSEDQEEEEEEAKSDIDLASIRAVDKAEVEQGHILDEIVSPAGRVELSKGEVGHGLDAFVIEGLVNEAECAALIKATEGLGFSFWNPCSDRTDFRNSDTIEVTNQKLADELFARVKHLVPPSVTIAPGNARWSKELDGRWDAVGINPVMLFNRYGPGGHFSPHTDGYTIVDFNTRSMYSTLVYLNDCPEGGATRMMEESGDACVVKEHFIKDGAGRIRYDDARIRASVSPRSGRALFFFQDTLHEGEPLGEGMSKYIIRTDVLYARNPPICDSEKDRLAYKMFREAELLECHDSDAALKLYMKVRAVSPELAGYYGLD